VKSEVHKNQLVGRKANLSGMICDPALIINGCGIVTMERK
jgi:hypothetical protein